MDWESLLPTLPESIDTSQYSLEQHEDGTASYVMQSIHVEPILVATYAQTDLPITTCS